MRAAIYVRVSTTQQAAEDRVSLPEQARELTALARTRGWQIVTPSTPFKGQEALPPGVFGDPGLSGDSIEGRPGLVALLEAVRAGGIDAVMVRDTNRLSRSSLAMQRILAEFEAAGIRLVTPGRAYDCTNDDDLLVLGMFGAFDQRAKRWLVGNMKRARHAKARDGYFAIRRVDSFGFRWNKQRKRPEVCEEEAEWVRLMYRLAVEGHSLGSIARELNRRGSRGRGHPDHHPPVPPGKWAGPQVGIILRNRVYRGEFITFTDLDGTETLARNDLWDDGKRPQIVDEATWRQAQANLAAFRAHLRPYVKRESVLSGFLVCGQCGAMLTVRQPARQYRYYACNQAVRTRGEKCSALHVPAHLLEGPAWNYIKRLQADPEMRRAVARETKEDLLPGWRERVVKIGSSMKWEQHRLRHARKLLEQGCAYTMEDFGATKAEVEERLAELAAEAEKLEAHIAEAEQEVAEVDGVSDVLEGAGDLDALTMAEKRRLLGRLGARLTIWTEGKGQGRRRGLAAARVRFESFGAAVTGLGPGVGQASGANGRGSGVGRRESGRPWPEVRPTRIS